MSGFKVGDPVKTDTVSGTVLMFTDFNYGHACTVLVVDEKGVVHRIDADHGGLERREVTFEEKLANAVANALDEVAGINDTTAEEDRKIAARILDYLTVEWGAAKHSVPDHVFPCPDRKTADKWIEYYESNGAEGVLYRRHVTGWTRVERESNG